MTSSPRSQSKLGVKLSTQGRACPRKGRVMHAKHKLKLERRLEVHLRLSYKSHPHSAPLTLATAHPTHACTRAFIAHHGVLTVLQPLHVLTHIDYESSASVTDTDVPASVPSLPTMVTLYREQHSTTPDHGPLPPQYVIN